MKKTFLACSMLQEEINKIFEELGLQNNILYIDAVLHVNLDLLKEAVTEKLNTLSDKAKPLILIGNKCHPDICLMTEQYDGKIVNAANCIELLLGNKMKELDEEAKTFYLTSGWLARWRDLFIKGLGWDSIDARQNFGYHDRILLIETGIKDISDEDLLEFFEYTQVPIERYPITLENLKKTIIDIKS